MSIKWVYVAIVLASPACFVISPSSAITVTVVAALVSRVVGLIWLTVAWSSFPSEDAHYTPFGKVSGFAAIMRFLIPLYDVYWAFVCHALLCNAINDALERREMPVRAFALPAYGATLLAPMPWLAGLLHADAATVAILFWIVEALWLAYVFAADRARRFVVLSLGAEREKIAARQRARLATSSKVSS